MAGPRLRARIVSAGVIAASLLAAAAVPAGAASRRAPPPPPPKQGPVEYLESLLPWTQVGPAPDFVEQSRPSDTGPFIPVGTEAPDRELQVKSEAELAASKASMEQVRAQHDALRAHPPALTAAAAPPPPPPPAATKAAKSAKAASKRSAKRKRPAATAASD